MSAPQELVGEAQENQSKSEDLKNNKDFSYTNSFYNPLPTYKKTAPVWPVSNGNLAERAMVAIAPWTRQSYPGRFRMLAAALPRKVGTENYSFWRTGAQRLPVDVAEAWAELVEAQGARLLALGRELRGYVAAFDRRERRGAGLARWRAQKKNSQKSLQK